MAFADLDSVHHAIAKWVEQCMGDHVDVCEMLDTKFPTGASRTLLSQCLQGLYEECVQAVPGADVLKDDYIKDIPVCQQGAVVHGHVTLWQLGFSASAALKGAAPSVFLARCYADAACCNVALWIALKDARCHAKLCSLFSSRCRFRIAHFVH